MHLVAILNKAMGEDVGRPGIYEAPRAGLHLAEFISLCLLYDNLVHYTIYEERDGHSEADWSELPVIEFSWETLTSEND